MEKYTEEERKLIERAFEITRMEFEKDPDPDNDEHVVFALKRYKNSYHMGAEKQKIATEIFRKNGLWKNGKTSLEEYNRTLLEKKIEQTIRYKESQEKRLSRLKDLQETITTSIEKIESEPKRITEKYHSKRKEFESQARGQLDQMREKLNDQLKEASIRLQEEYEKEKQVILMGLHQSLERLKGQETSEVNAIMKEYDELENLQKEYLEIEKESQREIERLEIKNEQVDAKLLDLTVRELKEIADDKGIEYPSRIVKKDLVDLIENNEEIIFEE